MMLKKGLLRGERTWKSIVTCMLGTDDDFSQNGPTLLLQQDDEAPQEITEKITNLNVH